MNSFKKKLKRKALWMQLKGGIKPNGKSLEQRRKDLDAMARGLRRVRPPRPMRIKPKDSLDKKLYRIEARAFVKAAIAAGGRCPVVAAVPELRNGRKYGHPISDRLNEVHHMRGRLGSLLRDRRFWIALSKQGHRWVHEHPEQARALGFLCAKGLWNKPEPSANTEQAA